MLYAKDSTKEQHVGYKHTCALMVLQMLCRWLVQIALCHSHTFPRLLPVAPLKVLTNVNVMVPDTSTESLAEPLSVWGGAFLLFLCW